MTGAGVLSGRPVLVTGAGGFIGSHLTRDLARRGNQVLALDLRLDRVRNLGSADGVTLLEGDVTDASLLRESLAGTDTVFHLAAAHLGVSVGEAEYRRVNVEGVRTLVREAAAARVRRFVHFSSSGVYGRLKAPPANEETPCNPGLTYERTKLEGERVVLEAARTEGFPAVVLRPVWVYGPGCGRTEKLFCAISKGRFLVFGPGTSLRHCVYVKDMVEACRLAADADAALGEVIIVGDDEAVSVRRLVDEIARITGSDPPRSAPLALLRLAAAAAEMVYRPRGKEPPISRRTLRFFTSNTAFDVKKARRVLDFSPKYDLASGLEETYRRTDHDEWQSVP